MRKYTEKERNVLWDRAYIQETPNGGLRGMDL